MEPKPRTIIARHESLPLARPFRISRGVKTAAEVIVVEITQDGCTGRGEGVPYPRYGESAATSLAEVERLRPALEAGADRAMLAKRIGPGAARNAVDCALWDLELRLAGETIFDRLDIADRSAPVATALTVGLDTPDAMGAAARAMAQVPLIKVKVDASDPAAQLRAVRAAAPAPRLIVDPNESWTMAEVTGLQDCMHDLAVDLLEQPLPAGEDRVLDHFRSRVPIAADESIHTLADLGDLPGGYSVVNVKLDKAGGLTEALALAGAAQARGLGVMTGCMVSSSLSIAPALALAIAAESAFVDLDGPVWLADDRVGGVRCRDGMLLPAAKGFWGERA